MLKHLMVAVLLFNLCPVAWAEDRQIYVVERDDSREPRLYLENGTMCPVQIRVASAAITDFGGMGQLFANKNNLHNSTTWISAESHAEPLELHPGRYKVEWQIVQCDKRNGPSLPVREELLLKTGWDCHYKMEQ